MGRALPTNFIDQSLATLDGAVAPIWISGVMTLDAPLDPAAAGSAIAAIFAETPRLRQSWDRRLRAWVRQEWTADQIRACLTVDPANSDSAARVKQVIGAPVDLASEPGFRLFIGTGAAKPLLIIQLHHALGDGRSIFELTRRLFEHLAGTAAQGKALDGPILTHAALWRALGRRKRAWAGLRRSRLLSISRRGLALTRTGKGVGQPILSSISVDLGQDAARNLPSNLGEVFYGAVLAAVAGYEFQRKDAGLPVRLRLPVDLRKSLGLVGPSIQNACTMLPVEIPLAEIRDGIASDSRGLGRLVNSRVSGLLGERAHWTTALECLLLSKIVSPRMLRDGARREILGEPRSNTLVVTFIGCVDDYFTPAQGNLASLQMQTAAWGVNGCILHNRLCLNFTAFDGIWSPSDLDRFVGHARAWLETQFSLKTETIRP